MVLFKNGNFYFFIVLKICKSPTISGPERTIFNLLFLTIADNIYKTVSTILLLRKVSNADYSGIAAGITYISFVLKDSKEKLVLSTFFYLPI